MSFEEYVTEQLLVEQSSSLWYVVRSLRKRGLLASIETLEDLTTAVAADTSIGAAEGAQAAQRLWSDYLARWAA